MSPGGSIYTMEIDKRYQSAAPLPHQEPMVKHSPTHPWAQSLQIRGRASRFRGGGLSAARGGGYPELLMKGFPEVAFSRALSRVSFPSPKGVFPTEKTKYYCPEPVME